MERRLVGHIIAVPTYTRRRELQKQSQERTHIGRMDIVLFAIEKVMLHVIVLRIRTWHPRLEIKQRNIFPSLTLRQWASLWTRSNFGTII